MKEERLQLLDWLKLLILAAIQTLHMNEFVFFEDDFPLLGRSLTYTPMYYYARVFALGGQGLISITYLLFGLRGKERPWLLRIAGLALIGQFLLTLALFENNFLDDLEWDIYFYIAATNVLIAFLPRTSWPLMLTSLLVLLIPVSVWKTVLPPGAVTDFFIGTSSVRPAGPWPLLPWFFLALLFFQLGLLIREGKIRLREWSRIETFAWPVLFGLGLPFLGHYYWTPIGSRYYEHTFHEPSWYFWANFLPYVFAIRLAFLDKIRERLSRSRASRLVSSLMWTRKVGVVYIVAVLYVGFLAKFDALYRENVLLFDLGFFSVIPGTELIVRFFYLVKEKLIPSKAQTPGAPHGGPSAR